MACGRERRDPGAWAPADAGAMCLVSAGEGDQQPRPWTGPTGPRRRPVGCQQRPGAGVTRPLWAAVGGTRALPEHRQNSVPVQATGPRPARTGSGRPRPSLWWESPGELGTPEPCSRPPGPRDPSPTSLKLVPGVQPPQPPARNPPVPPCPEPSAAGAGTRSRPLVPRGVAAWLAPRVGRAEGGPVPTRRGPLGPAGKHRSSAGCHHLPALEGQHAGLLAPSPRP